MPRLSALAVPALIVIVGASAGQARLSNGGLASPEQVGRPQAPPESGLRTLTIAVDQRANPLRKVAEKVSEELGIAIAYEEAPWVSNMELMRAIDSPDNILQFSPKNLATWDTRWRSAAVGSVSVTSDYRIGEEFTFGKDFLLKALDDHARRGNPGQFRLEEVRGYGYSIVPANIRDEQGQWISVSSPLSARISFPVQKRSLGSTLTLIAESVTQATQQRIKADVELPGINGIYNTATANIGADNEVARDVLAKALDGVLVAHERFPMWWHLEYFPDAKTYRLEFTVVHRSAPDGQWLAPAKPSENRKP